MKQTQHIYFCTDDKYVPYTAVTMASILDNATPQTAICFYLIGNDIRSQTKEKINELKKIHPVQIKYITVDENKFQDFSMSMGYLSQAAFYRFLIPSLAPSNVDKVLYLDGDMIVTGALDDLFAQNLEGYKVGAVEEKNAIQAKNLNLKSGRYFNSGMLLLNLKEIDKQHFLTDAAAYFQKHRSKIISHDQDILNGLWDGKVKFLEQKYNVPSFVKTEPKPLIIHYTGFMKKPWLSFSRHPQKKKWLKYLQMTAFKKNALEMFLFKIKEILSRLFLFKKDPTHTNYYIVHFFGIRFGIGKKNELQR